MDQKVIYCGVFTCPDNECEHHIKNGEKFDTPQRFNNLMGSEYCRRYLENNKEASSTTAEQIVDAWNRRAT